MKDREIMPVGGNSRFAVLALRAVSTLKSAGQSLCNKIIKQHAQSMRAQYKDDTNVVDVECTILPADRTQDVIKALREKRFIDAVGLLHESGVDYENAELLYFLGVNGNVLSSMGMVFDFAQAIEKSAQKGYADAQFEMAQKELNVYLESASSHSDPDVFRLKILNWLKKASRSGCSKATLSCARIYSNGGRCNISPLCVFSSYRVRVEELFCTARNVYKAKEFYEMAVQQGAIEAESELQKLMEQYNAGTNNGAVQWR